MSEVAPPKHGEKTKGAIWLDETAYYEVLEDPRQGLHLPDCGVIDCEHYVAVDQLLAENPIELTYSTTYGDWFCPQHWED